MVFDEVKGMAVIDISDIQGEKGIDWDEAQAAGLWGVIAKIGSGDDLTEQDSEYFEQFVAECEKRGIEWGAYIYSYAMSPAEVPSEIAHCKRRLAGKRPTLPIYFDMEDADGYKVRHGGIPAREVITEMIAMFCTEMEKLGYFVGWYCNLDWLKNHVNADQLTKWTFWYARPGVDSPEGSPAMWQCGTGETGSTWPGVPGLCDTNRCYENFPKEIKDAGLNNWGPSAAESPAPPAPAPAPTPAPAPAHAHSVGENVVFSTCYSSSTAPISEAIDANKMARNHGTITYIRDGAQNPYLLDGGLCWVNDGDIRGQYSATCPSVPATPQEVIYIVQPGDTLGGIADKYNTDYQYLARINGIADPNKIWPGDKIKIR